ncbi:MAG: winged helix-turn-helix domain-containing protein [Polyangiales bacterium]
MWILVIGPARALLEPQSAAEVLRQLGCEVACADLWDDLEAIIDERPAPAAVLVEALDQVEAARAAAQRCESVARLSGVPLLVGVSVRGLSGVKADDGFDDLVLHPYVPAELYLRIRRAEWQRSDFAVEERVKMGPLSIDLAGHEVSVDGQPVDLTQQEFALLRFFSQQRGRVFSRDQILSQVWGVDYYGGSRTVDIHVRRLRKKLGPAIDHLETVRGVGYKLRAPS